MHCLKEIPTRTPPLKERNPGRGGLRPSSETYKALAFNTLLSSQETDTHHPTIQKRTVLRGNPSNLPDPHTPSNPRFRRTTFPTEREFALGPTAVTGVPHPEPGCSHKSTTPRTKPGPCYPEAVFTEAARLPAYRAPCDMENTTVTRQPRQTRGSTLAPPPSNVPLPGWSRSCLQPETSRAIEVNDDTTWPGSFIRLTNIYQETLSDYAQ